MLGPVLGRLRLLCCREVPSSDTSLRRATPIDHRRAAVTWQWPHGSSKKPKGDAPLGEQYAWREMRRQQSSERICAKHANA